MNRLNGWSAALLIVAVAQLIGCGRKERIYEQIAPADVKEVEGQYAKEVELLSDLAIERIGLEVAEVSKQQGPRKDSPQLSIPYSALLYDPKGKEWVYAVEDAEKRVYVRKQVKVDYIEGIMVGDDEDGEQERVMVVFLKEWKPDPKEKYKIETIEEGDKIVSIGAEELYGTEKKIGHIDAYIRKVQEHK